MQESPSAGEHFDFTAGTPAAIEPSERSEGDHRHPATNSSRYCLPSHRVRTRHTDFGDRTGIKIISRKDLFYLPENQAALLFDDARNGVNPTTIFLTNRALLKTAIAAMIAVEGTQIVVMAVYRQCRPDVLKSDALC
jgi:hypothetical protein